MTQDKSKKLSYAILILLLSLSSAIFAQSQTSPKRSLSGILLTKNNESVAGITLTVSYASGEQSAVTGEDGAFQFLIPNEAFTLKIQGKYVVAQKREYSLTDQTENLVIEIQLVVPQVHESVVIVASQLDPTIDRRNSAIYKDSLFARDDQIFHTLDAGINAGQHEGGGKSVEVRRFGFNLDHGGVAGGLKVLVDDVQQNQGTQGHGQGYLGQLKSLTPELVGDVSILNGPFSAEYGDFSGLGVVHIRLKESLPDQLTLRLQGGSFDTFRNFIAYSPNLKSADAFLAYEASRTDGPFENPLRYKRDNLTGNYLWKMNERQGLGFKFNAGRNDFFSSGQLPLDEVAAGRLDRFGFIDPFDGGRVRNGTLGAYYRSEDSKGNVFKLDGFVGRSLFDLYSNFTFFLNDEVNGDEIQQHDSRLQEGANAQYIRLFHINGQHALFTAGANFLANQINVGLNHTVERNPIAAITKADARITNAAGYVQQSMELLHSRVHLSGGLRFDYFRFAIDDKVTPEFSGVQGASRFQPKAAISFTPSKRLPATVYFNYGRGISSQDARGIVQRPEGEKLSTTDFYQTGVALNFKRASLSGDLFLINRSNEQVYIPDDGSFELKGPSRADGFELKSSVQITKRVSFNSGVTKVMNAYYRDTFPRVYVDSAPHVVANAGLTLANWKGFSGSLRMRYTNRYRLDGENPTILASGLTVVDLNASKRLRSWLDFNLSIDNLTDKRYYETQNYFESRLRPGDAVVARINGTPGYPITVTAGLTFRFFGK